MRYTKKAYRLDMRQQLAKGTINQPIDYQTWKNINIMVANLKNT